MDGIAHLWAVPLSMNTIRNKDAISQLFSVGFFLI